MFTSEPLMRLMQEFSKMPGIGEKTAERLAFYVLHLQRDDAMNIAYAIRDMKDSVKNCTVCYNVSESEPCTICSSKDRRKEMVCVVEQPKDLWAIEKTGSYKGVYHVLHGRLSPLEGIGPENLTVSKLVHRVEAGSVKEVILATNPNTEGDATAYYLQHTLKPFSVRTTRLARGIPSGSSLEFANRTILVDAIEGRQEF